MPTPCASRSSPAVTICGTQSLARGGTNAFGLFPRYYTLVVTNVAQSGGGISVKVTATQTNLNQNPTQTVRSDFGIVGAGGTLTLIQSIDPMAQEIDITYLGQGGAACSDVSYELNLYCTDPQVPTTDLLDAVEHTYQNAP